MIEWKTRRYAEWYESCKSGNCRCGGDVVELKEANDVVKELEAKLAVEECNWIKANAHNNAVVHEQDKRIAELVKERNLLECKLQNKERQ